MIPGGGRRRGPAARGPTRPVASLATHACTYGTPSPRGATNARRRQLNTTCSTTAIGGFGMPAAISMPLNSGGAEGGAGPLLRSRPLRFVVAGLLSCALVAHSACFLSGRQQDCFSCLWHCALLPVAAVRADRSSCGVCLCVQSVCCPR